MAEIKRRGRKPAVERARRPKGTGSVRQRGDTWTALWFTVDPLTGERSQQSKGGFDSPTAAQDHLTSVLADVQRGTWQRDERITVTQLFDDHWLPIKRSENRAQATIAGYEDSAKWVKRRIGNLRVESLTPGSVAKMVDVLRTLPTERHAKDGTVTYGKTGLGPRSIQSAVGTLKAATAWAARVRLIAADPLSNYHRPGLAQTAVKAWSNEQARSFLASVADDRLVAAWTLMLTRGLRRGELAGLRWSSVDLNAGTVRIDATRVVVKGAVVESTPKTAAGWRTVSLDARLVELLRKHLAKQTIEADCAANAYVHSGYVVTDQLGKPMHPDSIARRFDSLVTKACLQRLTPHGLRHTAATLMLAAGVQPKVVQEMLGHSDISITLGTYGHVMPGMAEQAGEQLTESLLG